MKNKILITGGTGFIGSNLKEKLIQSGFEVLTIGRGSNEDINTDLVDFDFINFFKTHSPDFVCHCASGTSITRAEQNKEKEFTDTVIVTKKIIQAISALANFKKIIYLSSQAVYGKPDFLPITEEHKTSPFNTYGKCKLKAEEVIRQSKSHYIILRVSSVYGKNQDHLKSGVIANFINKMKNNEPPIVFNDINQFCDFIYINDLTDVIVKSIELDNIRNEIFNLGSGNPSTLKEVLEILSLYFPNSPSSEIKKSKLYLDEEQKGLYFDISKIQSRLKWSCKYDLKSGIGEMLKNTLISRAT